MMKSRTLLISMFVVSTSLASCGGGGGSGVAEQAGDVAATAGDAAIDAGTEAVDAVTNAATDASGALGDAIDPAAWQDIELNWDSQISSVQNAFPDLSVDEITGTAGKPQNLVSLVEQKYGVSREEAMAKVSDWASSL